jgi:hypothetical protein
MFRFNYRHQGAYYLSLLSYLFKNKLNKLKYIGVVNLVVWLQVLLCNTLVHQLVNK